MEVVSSGMAAGRTYFPNLDGLRFIAASLVIIWHTEHTRFELGVGEVAYLRHWEMVGHLGVLLFFVLSGFLITYLLLEEERHNGRVNVKDFLMRRVLRIWPLYFLLVVLALFVLPFFPLLHRPGMSPEEVLMMWPRKLLLFVLFLPTLVPHLSNGVPDAAHLWSIGTEEYFYVLWPLLLLAFKRLRLAMAGALFLGWPVVWHVLAHGSSSGSMAIGLLFAYWGNFNIDAMAVGACLAILLFRQSKVLAVLLDTRLFVAVVVATVALLMSRPAIETLGFRTYTVLFGLIVLNLAANKRLAALLERPWLRYLGRISYGLYIYHVAVVMFVVSLLIRIDQVHKVLIYPLVFLLTIAVAMFSHRFYESRFLQLKSRFRPNRNR